MPATTRVCFFGSSTDRWQTKSGRGPASLPPITAWYRPLPPITALVARRQFLIPLQQLRLPALQRDLLAPNQHALHTRRELERVSRPDDHVRHLSRLERAVAVRHSEDLRRLQRHGAQRLVPGHAVGDGVPRLLA